VQGLRMPVGEYLKALIFFKEFDYSFKHMKKYIIYYFIPSQNIFLRGEFKGESKLSLLSELKQLGYKVYNIVSIPA
jgi:hypothetical protein